MTESEPQADAAASRPAGSPRRGKVVVAQDGGRLEIAREAIANIVREETSRQEGIRVLPGGLWGWVRSLLSRRYVPRTIRVRHAGDAVCIDVRICVRYGTDLPAKAAELRGRITESVVRTTGCRVEEVNVLIDRVEFAQAPLPEPPPVTSDQ